MKNGKEEDRKNQIPSLDGGSSNRYPSILSKGRDADFNQLVLVFSIASTIGLLGVLFVKPNIVMVYDYLYLLPLAWMWIAFFWKKVFWIRGSLVIGALYLTGVITLVFYQIDVRLVFLTCVVCAYVFFGNRIGFRTAGLMVLTYLSFALFTSGLIQANPIGFAPSPVWLFRNTIGFLFYCVITVGALRFLTKSLEDALMAQSTISAELAQNKRDLQAALSTEKELNLLRVKMITTLSHNFRTPLAVIQNSSSLLNEFEDQLTNEKKQAHFNNIDTNIGRLTDLIEYILDADSTNSAELDQLISEMP